MRRRNLSTFVLFDVTYADGTKTSNRRVLESVLTGLDGEAAAWAVIKAQGQQIAPVSGRTRGVIKSIKRGRA